MNVFLQLRKQQLRLHLKQRWQ